MAARTCIRRIATQLSANPLRRTGDAQPVCTAATNSFRELGESLVAASSSRPETQSKIGTDMPLPLNGSSRGPCRRSPAWHARSGRSPLSRSWVVDPSDSGRRREQAGPLPWYDRAQRAKRLRRRGPRHAGLRARSTPPANRKLRTLGRSGLRRRRNRILEHHPRAAASSDIRHIRESARNLCTGLR